jgi:hypothetical protein
MNNGLNKLQALQERLARAQVRLRDLTRQDDILTRQINAAANAADGIALGAHQNDVQADIAAVNAAINIINNDLRAVHRLQEAYEDHLVVPPDLGAPPPAAAGAAGAAAAPGPMIAPANAGLAAAVAAAGGAAGQPAPPGVGGAGAGPAVVAAAAAAGFQPIQPPDFNQVQKYCRSNDPPGATNYRALFQRLFNFGIPRAYTHDNYRTALHGLISGTDYDKYLVMQHDDLQAIVNFFMAGHVNPFTPQNAESELKFFKRLKSENILACIERFRLLTRQANVAYPAQQIPPETELIKVLVANVGPQTLLALNNYQNNQMVLYFNAAPYADLIALAKHTEVATGEWSPSAGFIGAPAKVSVSNVELSVNEVSADVSALGLKDRTKPRSFSRGNPYQPDGRRADMQRQRSNSRERAVAASRGNLDVNMTERPPAQQTPVQQVSRPPTREASPNNGQAQYSGSSFQNYRQPTPMPQKQDFNSSYHNQGQVSTQPKRDQQQQEHLPTANPKFTLGRTDSLDRLINSYYRDRNYSQNGNNSNNRNYSNGRNNQNRPRSQSPRNWNNSPGNGNGQNNRSRQDQYNNDRQRDQSRGPRVPRTSSRDLSTHRRGQTVPKNYDFNNPARGCSKCGGPQNPETSYITREDSHNDMDCHLYLYWHSRKCNVCLTHGIHAHHYEKYCKRVTSGFSN